jgi:O-succinylbenzoic acid--CoA ligase
LQIIDNQLNKTVMSRYSEFYSQWQSELEYIIAHTSGSTGIPKEIRLQKCDMIASALATNKFFKINESDTLVCPLSLDYIAAKMMVVRALESNAKLILLKPSNNLSLNYECKLLSIVPSQVDSLVAHPQMSALINNVIIGGAPLSEKRRSALISCGYNAYETYGMTETCSHVALKHLKDDRFTALPGVTFTTDDRDCLVINIPYMSVKQIITNDVVKLVNKSSFIWLGRYDNVINTGGVKVHPEILEREISNIIGDKYIFYITSEQNSKWGQTVVMVIKAKRNEIEPIRVALLNNLDHKIMPKKIIAVEDVKRTSNGKIIRQILG